jgi:hypothetical protein
VLLACGRVGWSKKDTTVIVFNEWIEMWACGRVVWSKYERPSIFPFKTHSVLCCGLVGVWDGPKKIQVHLKNIRK